MKPGEPSGCDRDPIAKIRLEQTAQNPLSLGVTIDLSEHVASCCVNADQAFVEFLGNGFHGRSSFEFHEARPGHQFVAGIVLPAPGLYAYRIAAKILGRTINREGTYTLR